MPNDDLRAELAGVAASLRAYLEVQADAGTTGLPRRRPSAGATTPALTPLSVAGSPAAPAPAPDPAPVPAKAVASSVPAPSEPWPAPTRAPAPAAATVAPPAPRRSLVELATVVSSCTLCALHATRTQTVFARGNPAAALCFVGEAPGADEDAQGFPFVGRAGQLLDRMIAAMGLSPEQDAYVCNIIKCRPPGNRKPEPEETASCMPYLVEQLATVKPKVIVALGNTAVSTLLNTKIGISKLRGQWKLYGGTTLVMPTYHPSYLLRPGPAQSEAKRQAWEDLQAVMRELKIPPKRPAKGAPVTGEG